MHTPASKQILIRDATPADALALAELTIMAGHGLHEVFYAGLIPGNSTAEIIADRRILRSGNFSSHALWRVAASAQGEILGALNSFPQEIFGQSLADPLLTPTRTKIADAITELEMSATGTYYINILAVFPECRGSGVGEALMAEADRLARRDEFNRLTLCTFEADNRTVAFYQRQGFKIIDTRPIVPHPGLEHSGNWALMARDLLSTI